MHPESITNQRRTCYDRRSQTKLLGSLRFHGRRQSARRIGEGKDTYVDRPTRRVVVLIFTIVGCSILDALLTLLYIELGGVEANPIMALAINSGFTTFVGLKMLLTIFGVSLLALHQNFRLGLRGLYAMTIMYLALLGYHGLLWFDAFLYN